MAQRRMFSLKVTDTDAFCEMPATAQNLYFHIGMRADDDGFYAGVKGLMAKIHASIDDLNILLARHFLLDRGDGVYVVKHWKMNNYLQSDRYQPTEYQEKKAGLFVKPDGSYTLDPNKAINPPVIEGNQKCIQNVSIGKVSIGKDSVVKDRVVKSSKEQVSSNSNSLVSPVVEKDDSKEEKINEWKGLDSHQIIEKLVGDKYIQDNEIVRNAFLEAIQPYIQNEYFYEALEGSVKLSLKPDSDTVQDTAIKLTRFKSVFKTLLGSHGKGDEENEPF